MADEQGPQLFNEWIARHARGTLNEEATAALADVVESVSDLGKAGKVVIEVVIEPAGSGGRTVAIGGKVIAKHPQPKPELGVFYVGEAGSLHRDDPFQHRLPGVPVVAPDVEVRTVATEPTEGVRRVDDGETGEGMHE